ncbi:unnamed protein product [Trichobilharzia regenti]|nr:unnamed protein product [Trichobilharzia regenti]
MNRGIIKKSSRVCNFYIFRGFYFPSFIIDFHCGFYSVDMTFTDVFVTVCCLRSNFAAFSYLFKPSEVKTSRSISGLTECMRCNVLLLFLLSACDAFPFVALVPFSVALTGVLYKERISCLFYECCSGAVSFNKTGLERSLRHELHGQHIAAERVYHHILDYMNDGMPQKPLALSFHGYTGVGKNFVSNIVVNNILRLGTRSRFYHFYDTTIHFKHASQISEYKVSLFPSLL